MRNTDTTNVMVVMEVFKNIIQQNVRNVMLSYPKSVNRDIMHLGRHAWLWTSDEPEDADLLLINGGRQHY